MTDKPVSINLSCYPDSKTLLSELGEAGLSLGGRSCKYIEQGRAEGSPSSKAHSVICSSAPIQFSSGVFYTYEKVYSSERSHSSDFVCPPVPFVGEELLEGEGEEWPGWAFTSCPVPTPLKVLAGVDDILKSHHRKAQGDPAYRVCDEVLPAFQGLGEFIGVTLPGAFSSATKLIVLGIASFLQGESD